MRGWSAALAALLVAGCMGSPDDATSASTGDGSAGETASGAVEGAASASPTSTDATEAAPPADIVIPLQFEGRLPAFVEPCAFALVAGVCVTLPPTADFQGRFVIDVEGNVTAWTATLTWTPSSPATEQLSFSFHSFNEDFSSFDVHGRAFGPSPLVLEIAEPFALDPALTHRISVSAPSTGAGVIVAEAGVSAATEQDFVLDGSMTLRAAASAPP